MIWIRSILYSWCWLILGSCEIRIVLERRLHKTKGINSKSLNFKRAEQSRSPSRSATSLPRLAEAYERRAMNSWRIRVFGDSILALATWQSRQALTRYWTRSSNGWTTHGNHTPTSFNYLLESAAAAALNLLIICIHCLRSASLTVLAMSSRCGNQEQPFSNYSPTASRVFDPGLVKT